MMKAVCRGDVEIYQLENEVTGSKTNLNIVSSFFIDTKIGRWMKERQGVRRKELVVRKIS